MPSRVQTGERLVKIFVPVKLYAPQGSGTAAVLNRREPDRRLFEIADGKDLAVGSFVQDEVKGMLAPCGQDVDDAGPDRIRQDVLGRYFRAGSVIGEERVEHPGAELQ